ncbi:MAG: YidB family protein [Burkholderiales bacterium]
MGLLDGLLGEVMGGLQGRMPGTMDDARSTPGGLPGGMGKSALLMMVLQLLQQNGGIGGLLSRMQQSGYGGQAQSWIGTGQNQPIPPDAMSQIFGGQLGQIAQQLGMSHEQAASEVSQALPEVVDRMTPQGSIPAGDNDIVAQALQMLQGQRR